MLKKRIHIIWLMICCAVLLCGTAMAGSSGGSAPRTSGQTEIWAGVTVDYMAKILFKVVDGDTEGPDKVPIEGASVEIFIPSLDRYVLFGLTDENGLLELDVAYEQAVDSNSANFQTINGDVVFTGNLLYLKENHIKYKVYKSQWDPYPRFEEASLHSEEIPLILISELFQKKDPTNPTKPTTPGGGGGGSSSSKGSSVSSKPGTTSPTTAATDDDGKGIDTLPKTGVEGYAGMWMAGFGLFGVAFIIILFLMKKENQDGQEEQS